ncbi:hypothetical protein N8I77_013460 [Diaporthe amygdali]|uniref:Uncharacterized protein n=1 Tax=Phomopsis amygdali TaxID=1214568 RepID=A0AAD9S2I3_PHOAM|nr:hypothetical protein N8I77_013460 [Diaporthe amygdali]
MTDEGTHATRDPKPRSSSTRDEPIRWSRRLYRNKKREGREGGAFNERKSADSTHAKYTRSGIEEDRLEHRRYIELCVMWKKEQAWEQSWGINMSEHTVQIFSVAAAADLPSMMARLRREKNARFRGWAASTASGFPCMAALSHISPSYDSRKRADKRAKT